MPIINKTPKKTVMIVEDDTFLLNIYATKFEGENYNVVAVEDGAKGLEVLTQKKPDIILLDILMPHIDGFKFLKRIKSAIETKTIPVILLTNLSQREDIEKGLAMGANEYLIKAHFMPSEVVERVQRLISSSNQKPAPEKKVVSIATKKTVVNKKAAAKKSTKKNK